MSAIGTEIVAKRARRMATCSTLSLALLTGCSKTNQWNEEVQLQSGEVIQVHRSHTGHKTGGGFTVPGWKNEGMTVEITAPIKPDNPNVWNQKLVPMVLDRVAVSDEWFVVATVQSCADWYDLGRPKLPYIEYRFRNGQWVPQAIANFHIGREANLLTALGSRNQPDHTLESKRYLMDGSRQSARYKRILATWQTDC